MNKNLAGGSAVWRTLFWGWGSAFTACLDVVKEAAENGLAADFGSVSGDGHGFRCCTLGELLRDCDLVSVRAVQEKCDEKGGGEVRKTPCARRPRTPTLFAKGAKKGGEPGTQPDPWWVALRANAEVLRFAQDDK
jgi:hypothetical protein